MIEIKKGYYRLGFRLVKRVRNLAKAELLSFNDFVEGLFYREVYYPLEPNKETKEAIEKALKERKFLKSYSSAEELFRDIIEE